MDRISYDGESVHAGRNRVFAVGKNKQKREESSHVVACFGMAFEEMLSLNNLNQSIGCSFP
jgi:hypothetical protein